MAQTLQEEGQAEILSTIDGIRKMAIAGKILAFSYSGISTEGTMGKIICDAQSANTLLGTMTVNLHSLSITILKASCENSGLQ